MQSNNIMNQVGIRAVAWTSNCVMASLLRSSLRWPSFRCLQKKLTSLLLPVSQLQISALKIFFLSRTRSYLLEKCIPAETILFNFFKVLCHLSLIFYNSIYLFYNHFHMIHKSNLKKIKSLIYFFKIFFFFLK